MANEIIRLVLVTVVLSFLTVDGADPTSCPTRYDCEGRGMLRIETEIRGLPTDDGTYKHGFHVHESGDLSNGCESMGSHFNPLNATHGGPSAASNMRHYGDLGNVNKVNTVTGGYVKEAHDDPLLDLVGPNGIIGRGLVLHEKMDDLGLGGNDLSLTVGNAGARLACCVTEQLQRS